MEKLDTDCRPEKKNEQNKYKIYFFKLYKVYMYAWQICE